VEPRTIDSFARFAAQGSSRRQLLRYALGAIGGLALARRETSAQDPCIAPFISCNGECVYSLTSNEHCGTCDNACGTLVCIEGVCTACEDADLTTCEDLIGGGLYCADLTTSVNDCGACGNGCTTGPCVDGVCTSTVDCEPGFTECWGECVDLQTDTFHCGACSMACAGEVGPGESSVGVCVDGACQSVCLEGYTLVNGVCTESGSDDDTTSGTGSSTTLPATGSGASRDPLDGSLTTLPVVGAAAALTAVGLRWMERQSAEHETEPPV